MNLALLSSWSWPSEILAILVIAGALAVLFAWINSAGSRKKPLREYFKSKPTAKELIVLVHAYLGNVKMMGPVQHAIRAVRPDADILQFEYPAQLFSNANLFALAWQMEAGIDAHQRAKQYERITLCGYSIGALLVRKAYVYGCGSVADAPGTAGTRAVTGPTKDWTTKVDRLVLLAGMNRGWDRDSKQKDVPFYKRSLLWLGLTIARLSGTGHLLRHCEKGEPFVANLRLQWLEVMRRTAPSSKPIVIQLLGDSDDVVSSDDSKDVTVARDFIWVVVNNTDHANVAKLGNEGTKLERKHKIQMAFGDEAAVAELRRMNPATNVREDPDVTSVVFVLHGIRDMGEWTSQFQKPLQDAYLKNHPDGKSKLHVHRASYSYFGMGPFLLWADRQRNVRWFMDQVTELTAEYPNVKPEDIHFIGHSNGTYILASALDKYATLKMGRAALAGSVIRRDFPWGAFSGRIERVRNYVGAKDWVVGLLPRVFELPVFNFFNRDIGSAGFNGFEDGFAAPMETRFVRGAHGAALHKDNIPSIVAFITDGTKLDIQSLHSEGHPGTLAVLSNLCWILWIIAACLLVLGAWKIPVLGAAVVHLFAPGTSVPPETIAWWARGSYVFLVWLILHTV